ncbi:MAG TPA: nitroreductase family protein [Spirochaetota bacterium]|nr:nitroreductase family protein [Spirochaetota bacterium]
MAIPTTRTKENGTISINEKSCNGCGLCVSVCKDFSIIIENGKAKISGTPVFGCIACGHCMAICPRGAITVSGRCADPSDLIRLPDKKTAADYDSMLSLMQRRRSIREFKDQPVAGELIKKVITAAETAPMGLPPSDVNVLVFDSKEKVRGFAEDFCVYLERIKWFTSNWFLALMRPFWGKANDELFRGFVRPCLEIYTGSMKKGINLVNYDAPAALYFYGSPYSDPADPVVAATYAMIAAESLGLGTCMLGAIHPMIQNGSAAKKFRGKYRIKYKSREGIFIIMGYPAVKYYRGIKRTFASVGWN